ncbi:Uncharacterised protein [uncultured Ruminococcus sp.]|nr:Uncharacterised protein [uncultured Ruminococcus sp.]
MRRFPAGKTTTFPFWLIFMCETGMIVTKECCYGYPC